jgi:hypothetical protein
VGENADNVIERVSVPRLPVEKPTKQDLETLAKQIKGKIMRYLQNSDVRVEVFMPKTDKTATFTGQALFTDPIQGYQACKILK